MTHEKHEIAYHMMLGFKWDKWTTGTPIRRDSADQNLGKDWERKPAPAANLPDKAQHYTRVVNESENLGEAPDTRLAVYGTLAPGRVNHHQISALVGNWLRGAVRGQLVSSGWGAAIGFPGLILDPLGPLVDVDLFESAELPQHWTVLTSSKEVATSVWSQP